METIATTFFFEEIFPDYDTWQTFIQNNSDIVNWNDATQTAFDKYCFDLLFRHYYNCNIRYSVPSSFMQELLNVYQNKFKQFQKEKEIIDSMEQLKLDDLQLVQQTLTNMANNPNDEVDDPLQPLNYISAQTINQVTSNKLKAYLEALNNIPSLKIYNFFKAQNKEEMGFDDLFMNVQPLKKYLYYKGDSE